MNHSCISCGSGSFTTVLEFHNHPMFGQKLLSKEEVSKDFGIDFDIIECTHCGLVQIGKKDNTVVEFYDDEYICTTGHSNFEYQKELAKSIVTEFQLNNKKTIELGCGDGFFSKQLLLNGCNSYAIEPSGRAYEHAKSLGVNVERKFINEVTGKFDFFVLRQVLEHITDLNSFILDIVNVLDTDFNGIIEVPRLENIYEKNRIFEFYPEHVAYYDTSSLATLLGKYFTIDSILSTFDGQYLLAKVSNKKVLNKESVNVEKLNAILGEFPEAKVGMWGAGAKGINLLALLGKDISSKITLIDGDINKVGKYTPVTHNMVQDKQCIDIPGLSAIVISADMYKNEIIKELYESYGYRNKIIVVSDEPQCKNIEDFYQTSL